MVCSYCDKVALYRVQGRGYCGDHLSQCKKAEEFRIARFRAVGEMRRPSGLENMASGGGSKRVSDRRSLAGIYSKPLDYRRQPTSSQGIPYCNVKGVDRASESQKPGK